MALATRCPNCHALFRVAADQLKLRGGLVRCGACSHVFDATGTLSYIDDATLPTFSQAAIPAVGAVIAAIRKAESTASESLSVHGAAPLSSVQVPVEVPATEASTPVDVEAFADTSAVISSDASGPPGPAAATDDNMGAVAAGLEHPDAEGSPAERYAEDATPPVDEPVAPAFLREADAQNKRRRRMLSAVGALLLAAVLMTQLAIAFRADILVRFPQARPALVGLCKVFRCTVDWPARGDLLAVVGSDLQALPGSSAFELTAVVRNRGSMTLALPAIELTLSDTLNRTVARRVFSPSDYLAGESDPQLRMQAGLEPGADLTVRIAFEARGLNLAGFVVYPFYL